MIDPIYHISTYEYHLPEARIAQEPAARRDGSRLLVMPAGEAPPEDWRFADLPKLIRPGDLLVINDTRVFPARLRGRKESGGQVELLLLHYPEMSGKDPASGAGYAEVKGLVKSSKRPKPGSRLLFGPRLTAEVLEILANGEVRVLLSWQGELEEVLNSCGIMPLPPYIHRQAGEEGGRRTASATRRSMPVRAAPSRHPRRACTSAMPCLARSGTKGLGSLP